MFETVKFSKTKELYISNGGAWMYYPATGCSEFITCRNEGETWEAFKGRAIQRAEHLAWIGWA